MGTLVYFLCAATAFTCFALLWRGWRSSGGVLLFWSSLCFAGLTVSNVLLVVDKVVLGPDVDLTELRSALTLASLALLIFGLVWGDER